MEQRPASRWRSEWLWIGGAALALLLGVWWIPGERSAWRDTFSVEGDGKKVFYSLVKDTRPGTHRNLEPLSRILDSEETICLLGPARYPDSRLWTRLTHWVAGGGRLVFAARFDDPAVDMEGFGIKVIPGWGSTSVEMKGNEGEIDMGNTNVETSLCEGKFRWQSGGKLTFDHAMDRDEPEVLLKKDGKPQVIRSRFGAGTVIVAASDWIFSNLPILDRNFDHGRLAYRIFEASDATPSVCFEEHLNSTGTAKVFGILLDPQFRRISLQALLCTLLFGWLGSRRFGPPKTAGQPARRSIVEHAVALGNLHFKARTGPQIVANYLEYFRRAAGLHHAADIGWASGTDIRTARAVELLARWTKLEGKNIASILDRAERAGKSRHLASAEATRVIRTLAMMKKKLEHSKGAGNGT